MQAGRTMIINQTNNFQRILCDSDRAIFNVDKEFFTMTLALLQLNQNTIIKLSI